MPDNIAIVRRFYAAFAANDMTEFDAILSPDWRLEPPLFGAPGTRDAEKETVAYLHTVISDMTYAVEEIHACGSEVVACRTTLRGRQTGAFLGLTATDADIDLMTMELHQVRDGRIVHTWHLEDFFGVYQHLLAAGGQPVAQEPAA